MSILGGLFKNDPLMNVIQGKSGTKKRKSSKKLNSAQKKMVSRMVKKAKRSAFKAGQRSKRR